MPWLLCLLIAVVSNSVFAASGNIEQQRKWFSRAEAIAHKPKSSEYKLLKRELKDYPLWPYVELKTLIHYPYLSNKDNIARFLAEYEGTPMDKPLRKKWLKYLAQQNQQALFLHFYRDIGDAALTCKYIGFQLQRDDLRQQALQAIDKLWLVGKSQPKECDPIFKQWQQAGLRTQDKIWQRLQLAADGGKHTLIPYLKKLLPQEQRYLADLWLKVRRSPSFVSRTSNFPGTFPEKEAEILAYGLSRLVWRDRDLALKSWQALNRRFTFNREQQERIASKFALGLAIEDHKQAQVWLERANTLSEDQEIFRWHLAHMLRHDDWQHALDIVDLAPETIASEYSFQYWQARALQNMGAEAEAEATLSKLAGVRHYYGFLASGKLGNQPNIVDQPVVYSEQDLKSVADLPAAQRAFEFLQLKRYTSARREWITFTKTLEQPQKLLAAVVADSWGWHDQAIFGFARAGYMDDVKRRFPIAYDQYLVKQANKHQIDPAWAFAIVRRESSFMVDANSSAGASGLMQLMPSTARYLAKKKVSRKTLYDPAQNVEFGTQYMRYLMDKMQDNAVLATASYNAGWRRVKQWLPEKGDMPMDIWVETIPYKETRNYVKAVMAYKQIYSQRLGQETNLFASLANMKIQAGAIQ